MIDFTEDQLRESCARIQIGFAAFGNYLFTSDASEKLVGEELFGEEPDAIEKRFPPPRLLAEPFASSELTRAMLTVFEFVTTGVYPGREVDLQDFRHDLIPLRESWPLKLCVSPTGDAMNHWGQDVGRLELLFCHWDARLALMESSQLTIQQVALLAGLAEKSVRMAANPKNEEPLVTQFDPQDKRTYIHHEEAFRWLETKKGFLPTRFSTEGANDVQPQTLSQLGELLRGRRDKLGMSEKDLVAKLKPVITIDAYRQLEAGDFAAEILVWNVAALATLARALDISPFKEFAKHVAILLARMSVNDQLKAL